MRAFQIILGVLFALAALFAGGCALAFGITVLTEPEGGLISFLVFPGLSLAAAWGLGWLSLRFFRGTKPDAGIGKDKMQ